MYSRRGKQVYPRGTELNWTLYITRQGICSLPAKHVWKNRQKRRVPKGQGSQNCQDERSKISDQNGDTIRSRGRNGYVRDQKTTGYTQAKEKTEASYMTEPIYNQVLDLHLKPLMIQTPQLYDPTIFKPPSRIKSVLRENHKVDYHPCTGDNPVHTKPHHALGHDATFPLSRALTHPEV